MPCPTGHCNSHDTVTLRFEGRRHEDSSDGACNPPRDASSAPIVRVGRGRQYPRSTVLKVVEMMANGASPAHVVEVTGLHQWTARRWFRQHEKRGREGVTKPLPHNIRVGCQLGAATKQAICQRFRSSPPISVAAFVKQLQREGIVESTHAYGTVRALLRRETLQCSRPRARTKVV